MRLEEVRRGLGGAGLGFSGELLGSPGGFEEHVKKLRGTMFYVCQVDCLHRYNKPTFTLKILSSE